MKELSSSLKEFCEKAELMRLSYTGADGYPRVVPVWFAYIEGNYFAGTSKTSAKWKAILEDCRVGWVIDGGESPHYKGASFAGRAEEVTEGETRASIHAALGQKYFGSTDDPKFIEIYGQADDAETVYFGLKPEDQFSWEY